ncbi:MAG: hypothetical protein JWM04_2560 [Verrucomicrobiales bacterium]|nr:hypothetical protein [Verrucomicrobiales bacterium]
MSSTSASLSVAVLDGAAGLKIRGKANFTSSVDFKRAFVEMEGRGFHRFIIDLTDCVTMDSTFLGGLAGIGLDCNPQGKSPEKSVELLNPNSRIFDVLENLGVSHLFNIRQGHPLDQAQDFAPSANPSRVELTRNCVNAHETLMQVNPENVKKFKDCTQFMKEDLKKLEEGEEV